MKITDLLERQIDTQVEPDADYKRLFRRTRFNAGDESTFGNWARVAPSKKDPHMVVKNSTMPSRRPDSYNKYIQELIKRDLIDTNPHFPRIYNVKKLIDPMGNMVYKYVMEKLIPWKELSLEEMEVLARTIVKQPFASVEHLPKNEQWGFYQDKILDAVEQESGGDDTAIKQKSLKHAFKEISDLGMGHPNDLCDSNMMFRRTQHGVQLVITDPFY